MQTEGLQARYTILKPNGEPLGRPAFVLVEGHPWTKEAVALLADVAEKHGYGPLAYDLRMWSAGMPS